MYLTNNSFLEKIVTKVAHVFNKVLTSAFLLLALSGCVGMETSYKEYDSLGGGYGEEQLAPDTFIVFVNANDFTEPELTKKYFLRRAAQLTYKSDYDCFVIIEEKPTLVENYITSNKMAVKTKYFATKTENFKGSKTNQAHPNSLAGIIQMHKEPTRPNDCQMASTILKTTNLE